MGRIKKYDVGDVFEMVTDEIGNKTYCRILKKDDDIIFIEMYKLKPSLESVTLEKLVSLEPVLKIWAFNAGIKEKTWAKVGNIPIVGEVIMPKFWEYSPITGDLVLVNETPTKIERTPIEEKDLGDAQPFGIFREGAVIIRYIKTLKKIGLID